MVVFDKEAEDYDQWYNSKLGSFVDRVETELAFKLFQPHKEMKILDVGCGTGNFSVKLAEIGCKVVGIDLSEKMLNIARAKIKEDLDLEFHQMDVCKLDFSDEEFDGVFSMAAFEFIGEPQKAYKEMYRVLKKNGNLLIGTINRESKWGEFYLSKKIEENSVYKHAEFKTLSLLKSLNTKEIVDSKECLFIPPNIEKEKISFELEKELSEKERGGFICVLWKKGI